MREKPVSSLNKMLKKSVLGPTVNTINYKHVDSLMIVHETTLFASTPSAFEVFSYDQITYLLT